MNSALVGNVDCSEVSFGSTRQLGLLRLNETSSVLMVFQGGSKSAISIVGVGITHDNIFHHMLVE